MNTVGLAVTLLFAALVWVMAVDLARAVRSGSAFFRIGRWSGLWENPINKLTSPFAFWSAVVWIALWVIAISIGLSVIAIQSMRQLF
jgi:hypothetical protein